VTHGIDAVVDLMQPAAFEPPDNRAPTDAARKQLPSRHHAVLAAGQLRDQLIRVSSGQSGTHFVLD
jgi:hypothetical protein